ncbi:hypothetical protein [Streptomyces roseoviridis]|uniref:Uncharacterized protein n=1 Tax=Streptomyces roseoviridis TaxID=67361 RepID=A0ABV5QYM7_9ACTN
MMRHRAAVVYLEEDITDFVQAIIDIRNEPQEGSVERIGARSQPRPYEPAVVWAVEPGFSVPGGS